MSDKTFEKRKKIIYDFICDDMYVPMKFKEMAMVLQVNKEQRDELRQVLESLEEEGKICLSKRGKYCKGEAKRLQGTYRANQRGFGFVIIPEEDQDIFIGEDDAGGALDGDTVEVIITKASDRDGKRREGKIVKIVERGLTTVVGLYQKKGNKSYGFVIPDNQRILQDIFIPEGKSKEAVDGHKVVVELTSYGEKGRSPEGRIVEIIGHVNDPGTDIMSIIKGYDLPVEFPEKVLNQAERVSKPVSEADMQGRKDIRDWQMVTIDGEDAKDLDDAVSVVKDGENYILGVHIADVSHYVRENTALDKEAYARGTSVYLVDRVIPMLPHKLSNGICSLNPHVDRLALSCLMEVNGRGEVVSHRILESVINSDYRMTYTAVREILEDGTPALLEQYAEILPMLEDMEELRQILGEKRRKRGSVNFDLPESKIILDENGKPIDIKPYEKSIATNMIEEFMLVCNETIAENSFWQEMPFMYRSHQEPDEDKLEKMEQFLRGFGYYLRKKDGEIHPRELQKVLQKAEETDEERIITRMVLRSMMQARYTAENGGHFGLAAKYYCHFTSPIRRYPDLEIHRMIKKMLHGELDEKASVYYRRKMPDWAKHCSKQERVAEDAERDTDALKKVEFMEDKVGQIYEGIISGVTNWGIYVELPNTIEGMVALSQMDDDYYEFDEKKMLVFGKRTKKSYRLGDKVVVSVAKVDRMMGTIDFAFAEENEDFQE